jgi:ribonuclease P protein component
LDAERRLGSGGEFERLLRGGARRSLAGYTFYLARRDSGKPRLGLLVTRKHAAAATERNRIKRCIREAFRLEQEALGPVDLLVRPPYNVRPSAQMITRLRELLAGLHAK